MKITIVFCALLAITNAKFIKLWKKKEAIAKLAGPIAGKVASSSPNIEIPTQSEIPSNAVPVIIVPVQPPQLLQYQILPVTGNSLSVSHPYFDATRTAYFVNEQPSYLNAYQYYVPQSQIRTELLPSTLENSSTETISIASEHNPTPNNVDTLPLLNSAQNLQFIPASISGSAVPLIQQPIVSTYPPIQELPTVHNFNISSNQHQSSYFLQDGTYVIENSKIVDDKDGNKVAIKDGAYQRKGENGEIITVKWVADENGFRLVE